MQRIVAITAIMLLVIAPMAGAQNFPAVNKLGVGVNGGLMLPASGDITNDSSFSDFFKAGPQFGAHVNYTPIKELTLRTGFSYAFMKMKDEVRGSGTNEPYFTAPYAYVDAVLNLGSLIKSEKNIVNPYIAAGGGAYFWKVTDDGVGGDAQKLGNNEEFKKTSLGVHFGPGVEILATPALSIFAEGKYHIILTKDEDKFGKDFKNMGAIEVAAGLTYHFPLGK